MTLPSRLFVEPIEHVSLTEVVGEDGRMVSSETRRTVPGAFRLSNSSDSFSGGVVATDEAIAYLQPDVEVRLSDFFVIRGVRYEVVSTAFPQVSFRTGRAHHVEVRVRRSQR